MKKKISKLILGAITGLSLLSLVNCSEETSLVGNTSSNEMATTSRVSSNTVAIHTWDFTDMPKHAIDFDCRQGWQDNDEWIIEYYFDEGESILLLSGRALVLTKELTTEESNALENATSISYVHGDYNDSGDDWIQTTVVTYKDNTVEYIHSDIGNYNTSGSTYQKISPYIYENGNKNSLERYKQEIPVNINKPVAKIQFRINIGGSPGYYLLDRISFEAPIDKLISNNTSFRLKNRWSKKYMHIENRTGLLELGDLGHPGWWSAQWYFEKAPDGYYRIRNRWNGGDKYINNEDELDYLQVSNMGHPGWHSVQWEVNNVGDENYVQFRNRWKSNKVINNESKAPYAEWNNSTYPTGWWSSHWIIEVVE